MIVFCILGATGLLVGASFGATFLTPHLNNIPDYWSLAAAIATTLFSMSFIIVTFARSVRSIHLKSDRDRDYERVAELSIAKMKKWIGFGASLTLSGCISDRADDAMADAVTAYHACLDQHRQDVAPCEDEKKSYLAALAASERS